MRLQTPCYPEFVLDLYYLISVNSLNYFLLEKKSAFSCSVHGKGLETMTKAIAKSTSNTVARGQSWMIVLSLGGEES